MSSCGSPLMTLVMYQASVSATKPCLFFMFDKKSLLKLKKLMITPESCLHSTLRKFIHSSSTESITLTKWQLQHLEVLLELLEEATLLQTQYSLQIFYFEGNIIFTIDLVLRIFPLCTFSVYLQFVIRNLVCSIDKYTNNLAHARAKYTRPPFSGAWIEATEVVAIFDPQSQFNTHVCLIISPNRRFKVQRWLVPTKGTSPAIIDTCTCSLYYSLLEMFFELLGCEDKVLRMVCYSTPYFSRTANSIVVRGK